MCAYLNLGGDAPPALRIYLNMDNLADPPSGADWPLAEDPGCFERLAADGFEGIQWTGAEAPPAHCQLPWCGLDRVNAPAEADAIVARHAARGDQCLTLHAGWGIESDAEVDALVRAILEAGERHGLPVFIETHRATLTQDMWRTVELTKRIPEIRFNGDFSHYYCGQEMVYGGLDKKLDFMAPIFDRVGFLHGRVAAPGWMQAPIPGDDSRPGQATGEIDYWADFREIWRRAIRGFLTHAGPGDVLIFAPELLSGRHYYARLFPDSEERPREEADRYEQARRYAGWIRCLFEGERKALAEKESKA